MGVVMAKTLKLDFCFMFLPLGYLGDDMLDPLAVEAAQSLPGFRLQALRRRESWALELPVGVFAGSLTPGAASIATDLAARQELFALIKKTHTLSPYHARDIIERDDVTFYRKAVLLAFGKLAPVNGWYFRAAARFILAAEKDPLLIKGVPPKPLLDRPLVNGHRNRGYKWTATEDDVLRKWFGPNSAGRKGKRLKLTEAMWDRLLKIDLRGRRDRESVKYRMGQLNQQLKWSLMHDGYLDFQGVKHYKRECLGEVPRAPRYRQRAFGPYHGDHPAPYHHR